MKQMHSVCTRGCSITRKTCIARVLFAADFDQMDTCSCPAEGEIMSLPKRRYIPQIHQLSTFHWPYETEIPLKKDVKASNNPADNVNVSRALDALVQGCVLLCGSITMDRQALTLLKKIRSLVSVY